MPPGMMENETNTSTKISPFHLTHALDTIAMKFSCLSLSEEHPHSQFPVVFTNKEYTFKLSLLPYLSNADLMS